MRLWIVETRAANPGGHELELDRVLVEELGGLGHQVALALPGDYQHELGYQVDIRRLETKGAPLAERSLLGRLKRSAFSESRRRRLFDEVFDLADEYDAAIFPSATYRFVRSLKMSKLKRSQKKVVFLGFEGEPRVNQLMANHLKALDKPKNIKVLVNAVTFGGENFGCDNYHLAPPPAFTPRDVPWRPAPDGPLAFGFFGQFRREKNLGGLLDAILAARLSREVKFVIQINPVTPEDRREAAVLMDAYSKKDPRLSFITGQLDNVEWQEALLSVHAILMPYGARRFLWNWSSMLFSAIGFRRPVLVTETLNPSVVEKFGIGQIARGEGFSALTKALEGLVADFEDPSLYQERLEAAFDYYHPRRLAESLVKLIESD